MLRIGSRQYEIVRAQSGIAVELPQNDRWQRTQLWRLDAHYVPCEFNSGPLVAGQWEYLRVFLQTHSFAVKDWREFSTIEEDDLPPMGATLENLLANERVDKVWNIVIDRLEVKPVRDYLFHCKFEGVLEYDGNEENLELADDIPFTDVSLRVPINAADSVAAAQAMAARAIGPVEVSGSRVTPHDWRIREKAAGPLENGHSVTLETPWRNYLG